VVSGDLVRCEPEERRERAWLCRKRWVWAAIIPRGNGCINCGAPWFAPAGTSSPAWWKWTKTFVGGERSGKRGRGAEGKTLVFIAAEEAPGGIGRIRLTTIANASENHCSARRRKRSNPAASCAPTGGTATTSLLRMDMSIPRSCTKTPKLATPRARASVAALLKRWWLGTHQGAISPEHLAYYSTNFTFRFNRRTSRSRGKLFYRLIEQALQIEPRRQILQTQHVVVAGANWHSPIRELSGRGFAPLSLAVSTVVRASASACAPT